MFSTHSMKYFHKKVNILLVYGKFMCENIAYISKFSSNTTEKWDWLVGCVVAKSPWSTAKVMLGLSINLTTLFLGSLKPIKRLTSTQCTIFHSNRLPFLNQRKGENERRKDFLINLNERMLPDRSHELTPSWSPVELASNWATEPGQKNEK